MQADPRQRLHTYLRVKMFLLPQRSSVGPLVWLVCFGYRNADACLFLTTQWNCDIVSCVSSSPHAIRCRAGAQRERNGASIGTPCPALGGGRTPWWDGLARASATFTIPCKLDEDVFVSADYMQSTRITFNSREDAIKFAEKQGKTAHLNHRVSETDSENTFRLGLLCAAWDGEAHSSEELQVMFPFAPCQ